MKDAQQILTTEKEIELFWLEEESKKNSQEKTKVLNCTIHNRSITNIC